MRTVARLHDALVYGMAYIAAFLMAAMMVVITLDVILRNLGYQSSAHFFTFTEYALLIVPCLGAPWLAREKGHIYVEILLLSLRPRLRSAMTVLIGLLCITVCLVIAWYGFDVTLRDYLQNEKDVRSMDFPRWMVIGFIPLSFFMMAIEFARFLWKRENFLAPLSDITT
ncbi:MAG TPA: TRAP transporter small permease subunit [Burkholderiales bacterium]|nr:TRAP transporter small permease subunit [Burkholderiales bacterium]